MTDPKEVLKQLTSEEKIALLSGSDMWHTVAIPRLNIPRVRVGSQAALNHVIHTEIQILLITTDERWTCTPLYTRSLLSSPLTTI